MIARNVNTRHHTKIIPYTFFKKIRSATWSTPKRASASLRTRQPTCTHGTFAYAHHPVPARFLPPVAAGADAICTVLPSTWGEGMQCEHADSVQLRTLPSWLLTRGCLPLPWSLPHHPPLQLALRKQKRKRVRFAKGRAAAVTFCLWWTSATTHAVHAQRRRAHLQHWHTQDVAQHNSRRCAAYALCCLPLCATLWNRRVESTLRVSHGASNPYRVVT